MTPATRATPAGIPVIVVDDQTLVRAGFVKLLDGEPGIAVVAEAADRADVVLMDIRRPTQDGITATRLILAAPEPPRVLILSTYDLDEYVFDALKAGASGFLLKDAPPEQLIAAVRVVAAGDALLAPTITRRLITEFTRHARHASKPTAAVATLTARERDVLLHLARGRSNAEIAHALYVGEATVKTHVANLLPKLGLRDCVQAVVFAYENGLVEPGDARL